MKPIFLGMVGAMVRHLKSLRLMKRDHGWIHTLLEEAENERMHLMTALRIANPGLLMKLSIAGAQGKLCCDLVILLQHTCDAQG